MPTLACRALVLLVLALPGTAAAQLRASEQASVSQTIDGTVITVGYFRPRLRGRTEVFGAKPVPWDETWTPGANGATTLEVSRDVELEHVPLAKGKYSVWMLPRASGEWTLFLDPRAQRWHEDRPDTTTAVLRVVVHPETVASTEVLTWSVPEVQASGGTLVMQWGTMRVPLDIRVKSSLAITMSPADAARLVGEYTKRTQGPPFKRDFARLTVLYEGGTLKGEYTPMAPYLKRFALIRLVRDAFAPGIYDARGNITEVLRPDLTFTFSFKGDGSVSGVEARNADDELVWAGTRTP
jgi:hypothetical protein